MDFFETGLGSLLFQKWRVQKLWIRSIIKVRSITLDQKYNTSYLHHHHNRPPHLQRAVHFNEVFLHLQRPLHPFSGLHPQQMSSRHTACGIVIHLIENPPFSS